MDICGTKIFEQYFSNLVALREHFRGKKRMQKSGTNTQSEQRSVKAMQALGRIVRGKLSLKYKNSTPFYHFKFMFTFKNFQWISSG